MKNLFKYFANNHTLVNLLTILLVLMGIYAILNINKDLNPKVDFGRMSISTFYPGASPEDVEINVTNKLEKELKGVSGIKRMVSYSMEHRSNIFIWIDENMDNQKEVKDNIIRAIDQVNDFPEAVRNRPKILDIKSSIFPIIEVGIRGDIPYKKLRSLAKAFKKKLEKVSGVSNLVPFSYRAREISVEVSPEKMESYGISLEQIFHAIRSRNIRATGGHFESFLGEKNVVTMSEFKEPMDVGDVIVKSTFEGVIIKVNDLALVQDDFESPNILSRMNGKSAISFVVYKKEYSDIIKTVEDIKTLVEDQKKFFPDTVEFVYSDDMSRLVKNRFEIVTLNGALGLAMVFLVLTLFLNYRTAFWAGMGIPFSLFGTLFVLKTMGYSLDAISLSAIVLVIGIIVDDAIIITENIFRHYDELGKSPAKAAVDGLMEVFYPVLTTVLTTLLAFGPMFFMKGIMGKFIFVIPLVITISLTVSLLEAIFILPSHISGGLKKSFKTDKENWFRVIKKPFNKTLKKLLRFRYLVFLTFVVFFAGTLVYFKYQMGFILFPSSTAEKVYLKLEYPIGNSLKATSEYIKKVEDIVSTLPSNEMSSFVTRIGIHTGEHGEFNPGKHLATVEINLKPFGRRSKSALEIIRPLRKELEKITEVKSFVFDLAEGGPPMGAPITIRVVGSDDEKRRALKIDLINFMKSISGVKDVDHDDKPGKEELQLKIDYALASRLGLSVSQISNTLRLAYDGMVPTSVRYQDEDVEFRVILNKEARKSEKYIGDLLIANNFQKMIPLKKVAKFIVVPSIDEIRHFDGEKAITVTANVEKDSITPLEVIKKIKAHYNLLRNWPEMSLSFGGEADETDKSLTSLLQTFALSGVGIYFLLILLFNSFLQPFYVLVAIPFSFIGVILAFALHGEPVSFLATLGVIGLAGVAVNDSLVLVDNINQKRKKDPERKLLEVVAAGATDRLRAIVVTTFTTVVGLLPLAYGIGGVDPFMVPMALALGYGLIFATLLTLIMIPCLYLIGEDLLRINSSIFLKRKK